MPPTTPLIGRVVATELKPSTPHQFYFWTREDAAVGIGAIVRVEHGERTVYAVVTDGFAYADLSSPLYAVIGADGDPTHEALEPTLRTEVRLYSAALR